jgi:antitoxin ParD1/3/4
MVDKEDSGPVRESEARRERLAALDEALAVGLADADAGRVQDIASVFDRLERKYSSQT